MKINGSTILITGGTGSFGRAFTSTILKNYQPAKLIIFSRDEMKQWEMAKDYADDPRVRFFIGDVRDVSRLRRAFSGVDYVVHAAATKIVPTAEYNPIECIRTNVDGAINVIEAALDCGVKRTVALSTDKASSPINLYGATKLTSDKLFVSANSYSGDNGCKFSVVRYGNVMGSRGSVIPFFHSLSKDQPLPITDIEMTRFMITLEQGIELVTHAFSDMVGGEIYVRKIPSMNILDIAEAIRPGGEIIVTGIRPGEKMHEQMIGVEDAPFTYEYANYFKILPNIAGWADDPSRIKDGYKVSTGFIYSSERNPDKLEIDELRRWIRANSHAWLKI